MFREDPRLNKANGTHVASDDCVDLFNEFSLLGRPFVRERRLPQELLVVLSLANNCENILGERRTITMQVRGGVRRSLYLPEEESEEDQLAVDAHPTSKLDLAHL